MTMTDQHPANGICCAGLTPKVGQRKVRFTSVYADGFEWVVDHVLDVLPPDQFATTDEYDEYIEELIQPHTGAGHAGDAGYFAVSVDDLVPAINYESFG